MSNQRRFALIGRGFGSDSFDEATQDIVGALLIDSAEIDFTYTDATPSITAALKSASVVFAKIQDADALSVLGRASNSAGVLDEIAAGTDHQVLRRSGVTIGFGALNLAQAAAITGDLPFANLAQITGPGVLGVAASGTADLAAISAGTNDRVLRQTSDTLNFGQLTAGMFPNTVVPDAALSSNVPLLNAANTWTANQTLSTAGTRILIGAASSMTGVGGALQMLGVGGDSFLSTCRFGASATPGTVQLLKSRNATVGSHTAVQSGDACGAITPYGSDGSAFVNLASMQFVVDGTVSSGVMPGRIEFYTVPASSGSNVKRTTINALGELVHDYGLRFTGTISPTQLTANTDDWNPTNLANAAIIRATTDASRNLTGITAPSAGRVIVLYNVGSFDLVLKHDVTSTAANRFLLPNSADLTLNPNDSVTLWYDTTSSRWRPISGV